MKTTRHVPIAIGLAFLLLLAACASTSSASDDAAPASEDVTIQDSATAQCLQGEDWPFFDDSASGRPDRVATTSGDVDLDGDPDQITLYVESADTANTAWVRVDFDNGGVVTGRWLGESFEPIPEAQILLADLTGAENSGNTNEILFQVGPEAAKNGWSVLAVEDCSLLSTTLDGAPFVFGTGTSDGISTIAGCPFVSLDATAVQFTINILNLSGAEWTQEDFELQGTVWALLDSRLFSDVPVGDGSIFFPVGPTLETCRPAIASPDG